MATTPPVQHPLLSTRPAAWRISLADMVGQKTSERSVTGFKAGRGGPTCDSIVPAEELHKHTIPSRTFTAFGDAQPDPLRCRALRCCRCKGCLVRAESLTAPPEAATTQEKNMYHVKLAVKVLSVPPDGTAPPAMAPAEGDGVRPPGSPGISVLEPHLAERPPLMWYASAVQWSMSAVSTI